MMLTAMLACLAAGCTTEKRQEAFYEEANQPPAGITETDINGQVQKTDPDDWRSAPIYGPFVRVDPAFPNPIAAGFITVPVLVRQSNVVRLGLVLRAAGPNGRFVTLSSLPRAAEPGAYVFHFSAGLIGRRGLVRLYVFDGTNEIVSYGDVMLQ